MTAKLSLNVEQLILSENKPNMDQRVPESAQYHFARLSIQYYTLGRAGALYRQMPVLGNLLHHAAEMAMKAALVKVFDLEQLKKLSHHLPKIWQRFLETFPGADGARHLPAIQQLHRFEELRYPDTIIYKGAMIQYAKWREHVGPSNGPTDVPAYVLVLEDVDALMAFIYGAAGIRVGAYVSEFAPEVQGYLLPDNRHLKL